MKKSALILIIIGLVLLLLGIGIRLAVDNNADVQEANEVLSMFIGAEISPELVRKLIQGEMSIMGTTFTINDVLDVAGSAEGAQLVFLLWVYAYSTMIAVAGGVLTVGGIFLSKRKA